MSAYSTLHFSGRSPQPKARSMLTTLLPIDALLLFHDGGRGGTGSLAILFVFLGVLGTAGWLIFSELKWRNTLLVTAAGWVVVLGLSFGV